MIPVETQLVLLMVLPFFLGLMYIKQRGDREMTRANQLGKVAILLGGVLVTWSLVLAILLFTPTIGIPPYSSPIGPLFPQALSALFISSVVWFGIIIDFRQQNLGEQVGNALSQKNDADR